MTSRALPSLLLAAALSGLVPAANAADGAPSVSMPAPAASPAAVSLLPADAPLPAVKLSDDPVDFDALRLAYGRRLDFHQRCELAEPRQAWKAAMTAKDAAGAYDLMAKFLVQCPVSETGHLGAMSSSIAMKDDARAALHRRWFLGLTDAVLKSGDGSSPHTAWVVISVAEEYATLIRLGRTSVRQALLTEQIDMMTTVPESGEGDKVDLYFNPALHFARLARDLHPPK